MGLIADSVQGLLPEFKTKGRAIASMIPTWQAGAPQYPLNTRAYERLARQAYMADEIIFACCKALAKTASEPRMVAFKTPVKNEEPVEEHMALAVLSRPNKFWTSYQLWAATVIAMKIAGNAYWEKVRSQAGNIVEYWPMRPDRVRIIPDAKKFIAGYEYRIGADTWVLDPDDVIHFKDFHPLDDYYGMPPLAVLAERADIDVWSREFALAFFRNAGVPSGMLNIQRSVDPQERELIRQRFRQQYGGPQGWGNVLVIDNGQASYTAMGMGLGANGLALSELNQINESRICAVLDVPPSIVWTVLGHSQSALNSANKASDREHWWQVSVAPMYVDLAQQFSLNSRDDYPDLDRFEFDTSEVPGMSQDEDKVADRARKDFQAGGITLREFRLARNYPETPDEQSVYLIAANMIPTSSDTIETPAPEPVPGLPGSVPTGGQPALPAGAGIQDGTAPFPDGGPVTKLILRTVDSEFDVILGCPAERFGEHWRSRTLKVCTWCGRDPLALELKAATLYTYQSTQLNLPDTLASQLLQWARDTIPTADLGSGGFEDQPHVTLKYGLLPDVAVADVQKALNDTGPVELTFGPNYAFTPGTAGPPSGGVPLYMAVDSPDLHALHALLLKALPNVEAYSTYQPHVTLAYLTPDAVSKYVGKTTPLAGLTITLNAIAVCGTDGTQKLVSLRGAKALSEGLDGAGGVFVPPDEPARRRRPKAPGSKADVNELREYWKARFAEGAPEDYDACVASLTDHPGVEDAKTLCSFWHHESTGEWAGEPAVAGRSNGHG